jgi:hypothetical protein
VEGDAAEGGSGLGIGEHIDALAAAVGLVAMETLGDEGAGGETIKDG